MSSPGLDDQVLLVRQTLEKGAEPRVPITIPLPIPRYFVIKWSSTNAAIYVKPPKGKKWTILEGRYVYTASVAVADRGVRLEQDDNAADALQYYFLETVVASAKAEWMTGHPAPSANGAAYDTLDKEIVCLNDAFLVFYAATNGQAADTLLLRAIVKEEVDFGYERPEG